VDPMAKLAVLGVTAMDVTAVAVTVSVALPLTPLRAACTVVDPAATPVASPAELMVATEALPVVQVAVDVTFAVELSL